MPSQFANAKNCYIFTDSTEDGGDFLQSSPNPALLLVTAELINEQN